MGRSRLYIFLLMALLAAIAIMSVASAKGPVSDKATEPSIESSSPQIEVFQLSFPISSKFAISRTLSAQPRYTDYTTIIDHNPPFYRTTTPLEPYTGEKGPTIGTGPNACGNLGPSERDYCYNGHSGLDIAVPTGTRVYAAHSGIVIDRGESGNCYGIWVILRDIENGQFLTLYGHLSSTSVFEGQRVARGEQIALSGNTGGANCSTGAHLHWGLYYDPTLNNRVPRDQVGQVLDPYGWFSRRNNNIAQGTPVPTEYQWAKGITSQSFPKEPPTFDLNEGTVQGHEYINKSLVSNGVFKTGFTPTSATVGSIERWWTNNLGSAGPPMSNAYTKPGMGTCQEFEGGTYCDGLAFAPYSFTDVGITHWAHRYIQWAAREYIIGGYGDNTFRPSNFVTRAQFSKMTTNAFMLPAYTPQQPTFCDVPTSLGELYVAVETLAHEGIIAGYPFNSPQCVMACGIVTTRPCFLPGAELPRGQMTKFVAESARKKWGLIIDNTVGGPDYWDVPTNDAFYSHIRTLHSLGAIRYRRATGDPNCPYQAACSDMGHFFWGWSATRAQVAQLLHETVYSLYCTTGDARCPHP